MSIATSTARTRERLLDAAVEVFSEVGYRDATFRQICLRAEANCAAINYYFRSKEHLYLEVLRRAIAQMNEQCPPPELDPAAGAEERLRAFIASMMQSLLGKRAPTGLLKIMAHEMAEPTQGLELVVEEVIAPMHRRLGAVIRDLIGPQATPQQVSDCIFSVLGQCNCFRHAQPLVARVSSYREYDDATIEHLVDHVTQFSLAGIRAIASS